LVDTQKDDYHFEHDGFCALCEKSTTFVAEHPYFRNSLKCSLCKTVPRNRAIWHYLNVFAPNWRNQALHESSPGWDLVSQRLTKECGNYVASQYDPAVPFGTVVENSRMLAKRYRSENLEDQTFPDNSFDVVVTQDVFEHVFRPDRAILEIARTLKPGGITIMTVPITRKMQPSRRRAELLANGEIRNVLEPQYHGNPLSKDGSLVTIDWGYDIVTYFQHHSGLSFLMLQSDNIDLGIKAELCEVLVGVKREIPVL
jgi:hypothetical protein